MRIRFEVTPGACLMGAAALLILPFRWVSGIAAAATVHELGHLLALRFFRLPECHLEIGGFGAKITTGCLTAGQEILSALAGPVASFSLLLLDRFPVLGLIGLVQGLFNLLPIYPLDGGRALRALLSSSFPGQAGMVLAAAEAVTVVSLMLLFLRLRVPIWMGVAVFLFIGKPRAEKYLAKMRRNRYNGSD